MTACAWTSGHELARRAPRPNAAPYRVPPTLFHVAHAWRAARARHATEVAASRKSFGRSARRGGAGAWQRVPASPGDEPDSATQRLLPEPPEGSKFGKCGVERAVANAECDLQRVRLAVSCPLRVDQGGSAARTPRLNLTADQLSVGPRLRPRPRCGPGEEARRGVSASATSYPDHGIGRKYQGTRPPSLGTT